MNLKGRVSWVKVYEPDEYSGDQRWMINLYPFNDNEWEKFERSGLMLTKKEDKEGGFYITLRRPTKKMFPRDEEITRFPPPTITGAVNVAYVDEKTNEPVKSYKKSDGVVVKIVGEQTPIGNGSVVIANICTYDTAKGKGHRLEGLNVLDLVVYDSSAQETTKVEVPKVEEKKAAKPKASVAADMDDSVPW